MAYLTIVDDDADFASAVANVLRDAGHEVQIETGVDDAITHMAERPPDLIILDVMFPEDACGGFELARALRHRQDCLRDTPILILTALNTKFPLGFNRDDIDDQWLPVSAFVEKPVDLASLPGRVESLLQTA